MQRQQFVITGAGVSVPFPLDTDVENFQVGLGAKISATATYTVEYTMDDVFPDVNNGDAQFVPASATWYPVTGMSAATTNTVGNFVVPVAAVRLNVASSTGTVTLAIIQAGGRE